jgi:hypothetical protein
MKDRFAVLLRNRDTGTQSTSSFDDYDDALNHIMENCSEAAGCIVDRALHEIVYQPASATFTLS